MSLRAGAAVVDITPPPGLVMAGYGARSGTAVGRLAPLSARVLCLRTGDHTAVLVVLDTVAVGRELTAVIRKRLGEEFGFAPAEVMVTATHTHSGVSMLTGSDVPPWLGGEDEPARLERVTTAVLRAVREAVVTGEPARLVTGAFEVPGVGCSRRDPRGRGGDAFQLLTVERLVDQQPIAVLVSGEIHPTILEADNLRYSPDYPGSVRETVERTTGAIAIFLTGAAGDINPIWTEHTPEEAERVGSIIGLRAAETVLRLRRVTESHRVINLSRGRDLTVPGPNGHIIESAQLDAALEPLRLRERILAVAPLAERRVRQLAARLESAPDDRWLLARYEQARIEHTIAASGQGARGHLRETEIHVLRLGRDCVIVGLPGEFFVDTRRRLASRLADQQIIVAGYANDYLSYVPPAEAFADAGYEVGCARFPPEAERQIRDVAVGMVRGRTT